MLLKECLIAHATEGTREGCHERTRIAIRHGVPVVAPDAVSQKHNVAVHLHPAHTRLRRCVSLCEIHCTELARGIDVAPSVCGADNHGIGFLLCTDKRRQQDGEGKKLFHLGNIFLISERKVTELFSPLQEKCTQKQLLLRAFVFRMKCNPLRCLTSLR